MSIALRKHAAILTAAALLVAGVIFTFVQISGAAIYNPSGGGGLAETDIDTEAELETVLTDVSDIYTDNDTVVVADGGTGASTLTDGGLLLGSGTGAVTAMSVLTDGSIVVGDGTTDPVSLAAFTSSTGLLKHESGGIELDISGIGVGDVLAGASAGTIEIVDGGAASDGDVLTIQADGTANFETPSGSSVDVFSQHNTVLGDGTSGDFGHWTVFPSDSAFTDTAGTSQEEWANGIRMDHGGGGRYEIGIQTDDGFLEFDDSRRAVFTIALAQVDWTTTGSWGFVKGGASSIGNTSTTASATWVQDSNETWAHTANDANYENYDTNQGSGVLQTHVYSVDYDPDNNRVRYWLDGSLVATHTTYEPTSVNEDMYLYFYAGNSNADKRITSYIVSVEK